MIDWQKVESGFQAFEKIEFFLSSLFGFCVWFCKSAHFTLYLTCVNFFTPTIAADLQSFILSSPVGVSRTSSLISAAAKSSKAEIFIKYYVAGDFLGLRKASIGKLKILISRQVDRLRIEFTVRKSPNLLKWAEEYDALQK